MQSQYYLVFRNNIYDGEHPRVYLNGDDRKLLHVHSFKVLANLHHWFRTVLSDIGVTGIYPTYSIESMMLYEMLTHPDRDIRQYAAKLI